MKTASVADVKSKFSAYVKESERGPVVITRNGRAVAAIIALEDDEALERLMISHSPRLRDLLAAARGRINASGGVPARDFWKRVRTGKTR